MTNILLSTLDLFRGDCLSLDGHPLVRTPNLDRLAAHGVAFRRHYSQAAPCSPGRAALYTGTYQSNNRVVANGTPLDARFDNVALAACRAGYKPALFGYTDQGIDPRLADGPNDPRLSTYEGVLPGFDCMLDLTEPAVVWTQWLRHQGHDIADGFIRALITEPRRPAEHSISAFTTTRVIEWLDRQTSPWFAHVSYLRPHPPYTAAGHWASAYAPDEVPRPTPAAEPGRQHRLHQGLLASREMGAPTDPAKIRALRAQYFGMIAEVDDQLGRLWDALVERGAWGDTFIVVTADHGEQLGDQGLIGKGGFFESSYHVLGIVRDPSSPTAHGSVVEKFTENVDIFPTLCDAMGIEVPAQCDGLPLTPFLRGEEPPWWREAAHWEFDWRATFISAPTKANAKADADDDADNHTWPWDRRLERQHLAVLRTNDAAYVQFGDGSWRCFDLAADPTWRDEITDPATVLGLAQQMLTWRSTHTDRTMTDMLLEHGGIGRMPPGAPSVTSAPFA